MISIKFVCAHQGKYKRSRELVEEEKDDKEITENEDRKKYINCSTVKCGCEASMQIVLSGLTNGNFQFLRTHNHKIVYPVKRMKMKWNKHMPKAAKSLIEAFLFSDPSLSPRLPLMNCQTPSHNFNHQGYFLQETHIIQHNH